MQISTVGIDLAKNVVLVHGVDAAENPVLKRQLRRGQNARVFRQATDYACFPEAVLSGARLKPTDKLRQRQRR